MSKRAASRYRAGQVAENRVGIGRGNHPKSGATPPMALAIMLARVVGLAGSAFAAVPSSR
jgi:hypothetical protein